MRTIKFRGKTCEKDSRWIYGYLVHNGQFWYIQEGIISHGVEESSIGQFTGLFDREGKEIWEGDVVKYQNAFILEVRFSSGGFHAGTVQGCRMELCEVLGNIYENKELLS